MFFQSFSLDVFIHFQSSTHTWPFLCGGGISHLILACEYSSGKRDVVTAQQTISQRNWIFRPFGIVHACIAFWFDTSWRLGLSLQRYLLKRKLEKWRTKEKVASVKNYLQQMYSTNRFCSHYCQYVRRNSAKGYNSRGSVVVWGCASCQKWLNCETETCCQILIHDAAPTASM